MSASFLSWAGAPGIFCPQTGGGSARAAVNPRPSPPHSSPNSGSLMVRVAPLACRHEGQDSGSVTLGFPSTNDVTLLNILHQTPWLPPQLSCLSHVPICPHHPHCFSAPRQARQ